MGEALATMPGRNGGTLRRGNPGNRGATPSALREALRLDFQKRRPMLQRIAREQLVLVNSGATDWLDSSGTAERVDGGYRVTARKAFCSGSPAGDLLLTSAIYEDPNDGPTVLHFGVPIKTAGLSVLENWRTMAMRASGSNDIVLDGVFVPDGAISARRPKGAWTDLWNVVVAVAGPLVTSAYLGVAEAARDLAIRTLALLGPLATEAMRPIARKSKPVIWRRSTQRQLLKCPTSAAPLEQLSTEHEINEFSRQLTCVHATGA